MALVASLILVTTMNSTNSSILMSARMMYAMARDKTFFKQAASVHPTYNTPDKALFIQAIWAILLLFSGSFWATIVMASSLEFGKIMATSFLYRYWNKINKLLKAYLISAVLILMGITSLGVFGFLSQAFYTTKANIDSIESQVSLLEAKKNSLNTQISSNTERIKTLIDTRKEQESNLSKALNQSTTTTVTKSSGLFGGDKQETVIDKKSVELKSQTLNTMQANITNLESNIEKINNINNNLNSEINNTYNIIHLHFLDFLGFLHCHCHHLSSSPLFLLFYCQDASYYILVSRLI
jgi:amino acid transporter